ncbi:MAG: hypothetical protein ACK5DG_12055 [Chitinophagaceae bacterium]
MGCRGEKLAEVHCTVEHIIRQEEEWKAHTKCIGGAYIKRSGSYSPPRQAVFGWN